MMTTGSVYNISRPGDHVQQQQAPQQSNVDAERLAALEEQAKKNEELIKLLTEQVKAQATKVEETLKTEPVVEVKEEIKAVEAPKVEIAETPAPSPTKKSAKSAE